MEGMIEGLVGGVAGETKSIKVVFPIRDKGKIIYLFIYTSI